MILFLLFFRFERNDYYFPRINNHNYTFYCNNGKKIIFVENIKNTKNSTWSLYDLNEQLNEKIYINNNVASKFTVNVDGDEIKIGDYKWDFLGSHQPGKAKYLISYFEERLLDAKVTVSGGWMGPPGAPGITYEDYAITPVTHIQDLLILSEI